jgi:predicted transposase/invertase (TIGR01784 family)
MQNSWKPFFKDRTLYYASKPIRDQGVLGIQQMDDQRERKFRKSGKPWNFRLNEVCLIAIMNFTFPKKEYGHESYFHKVMLSDIDDHHVFYDKLTLYYVEMPKLDNIELELKTPRDKWLHALYHLWRYDDYPKELDEDIFRKFYVQAEYANFTPAQQLEYERSRKFYLDMYNEIEGGFIMGREEGYQWGFEEGAEEGRERGLAEGLEKGRTEGVLEVVRKMRSGGMDMETVCQLTGLTEEEILAADNY